MPGSGDGSSGDDGTATAEAGTQNGSGSTASGSGGTRTAGADTGGAQAGSSGAAAGQDSGTGSTGSSSGGGLDNLPELPGADGSGDGSGAMTRQEQVAVLEGQLERGYEDFDGMINDEAARARRESDEVGADPGGLYEEEQDRSQQGQDGSGSGRRTAGGPDTGRQSPGGQQSGDGDGSGADGGVIAGAGTSSDSDRPGPGGQSPEAGGSGGSVGGPQGGPASGGGGDEQQTFPVPDDIPSGRDDDVVARQIREAAMQESDPELRERLWDEYRRYKGLEVPPDDEQSSSGDQNDV